MSLLNYLKPQVAGFSPLTMGLRDGILAQMLAEQDPRATAHQQFECDRWESVLVRRMESIRVRPSLSASTPRSSSYDLDAAHVAR